MGRGEEGVCTCKRTCAYVHRGIRGSLMLTAGQQTTAHIFPLWGLAEEELLLCDFSRWSQGGSELFATPTVQLQLTLLFHPGAGKPGKTVPPPLSPRARVLSAVGSVAARMMEPYCLASDGPSSSLGPAVKTLIVPAVCNYLQQPFRPHYNLNR